MQLLDQIDEDDEEYYSEIFIDDLETGDTGSILDEAVELHNRYQEMKLIPSVQGEIIFRKGSGIMSKSTRRFF